MKVIVKEEEHEYARVTLDTPTPIPMAEEDVQNILPPVTPVDHYNFAIIPRAPSPDPFNPVSKKHHAGHSMPERDASEARCLKPNVDFLANFNRHSDRPPPNTTSHVCTPEFFSELERRQYTVYLRPGRRVHPSTL